MRMLHLFLTGSFLLLGSSLTFAEGLVSHSEEVRGEMGATPKVEGKGSKAKEEKFELLESRLEELEARIDRVFSGPSSQEEKIELVKAPYDSEKVRAMEEWTPEDHMVEARANQQSLKGLEDKIQDIQARIDRLAQRPHLDPKGFKRSSLEILKGKLVQEQREATVRTAWHKAQAKESFLSLSKDQQNS